jgi:hypothetical protein
MMCPATDNPASCKIRAVIHFLHAKNMSAAEIHLELCAAAYDQHIMSEGIVSPWCRMFIDGRTNVHDEERSGRAFVVSDDFVHSVEQQKNVNFRVNFHKFHALFSMRLPKLG